MDDTQTQVAALMQSWIDAGSSEWINGQPGLGAWRADRDADGRYDQRQAVVLMDAWYPHLIDALLPQVTAIDGGGTDPTSCSGLALQCRYDAPRAQGSAYEYGYYEMMKRVLEMSLATPGHTDYQALKCAGTGAASDCRTAVADGARSGARRSRRVGGARRVGRDDARQRADAEDGRDRRDVRRDRPPGLQPVAGRADTLD